MLLLCRMSLWSLHRRGCLGLMGLVWVNVVCVVAVGERDS